MHATICRNVAIVTLSERQSLPDDAPAAVAEAKNGRCHGNVGHSAEISPRSPEIPASSANHALHVCANEEKIAGENNNKKSKESCFCGDKL